MVDPNQLADIFKNAREMERMVAAIIKIESAVTSMAQKMGIVKSAMQPLIKDGTKGAQELSSSIDDVNDTLDRTKDTLEDITDASEKFMKPWTKFGQVVQGSFNNIKEGLGKTAEFAARAQTDPENAIMGAIRGLPMGIGAVLEILVKTQTRLADFAATGKRAALDFQALDASFNAEHVKAFGKAFSDQADFLDSNSLGTAEELAAVYKTAADAGIHFNSVMADSGIAVSGFSRGLDKSIATASFSLDKAFKLAAGTSINFAGQLSANINDPLNETLSLVGDLEAAAGKSGLSMMGFMNTIMQASSALRTQGGDVNLLASAYFTLQDSMMKGLGKTAPDVRTGTLAAQATQGTANFLGNLSDPMKGAFGRAVAEKLLGKDKASKLTDIDILNMSDTGFQFETDASGNRIQDGQYQAAFLEEMWKGPKLRHLNKAEKLRFMRSQGVDAITARGVADAMENNDDKGLFNSEAWNKAKSQREEFLKQAAENEPLKKSGFDVMMKNLMSVINGVGELLFSALTGLMQLLAGGIEALIHTIQNPYSDPNKSGERFGLLFDKVTGNIGSKAGKVANAVKKVGIDGALSAFEGLGGYTDEEGNPTVLPPLPSNNDDAEIRLLDALEKFPTPSPINYAQLRDEINAYQSKHHASSYDAVKHVFAAHNLPEVSEVDFKNAENGQTITLVLRIPGEWHKTVPSEGN